MTTTISSTLPPLDRLDTVATANTSVKLNLKAAAKAARIAYRWKSYSKDGRMKVNKGPTIEELRQQALDRAKQSMYKESGIIMGKLKRLTCLVANMRRETDIDAEYVRLEIKKLTKRAIQEIYAREEELLEQVDKLVKEANTTLDGQYKQLSNLKTQFNSKEMVCSERLEQEIDHEVLKTPAPLITYQENVQQALNFLKTNEANYKRRWVGFRTANEPNFKNTVKVLGFVGISDPRAVRPWRSIGKEGIEYGQFRGPVGIDVSMRGEIAISDFENHRVQLLDKNEEFKGVFGSKGSDSGSMKGPNDVKCDKDGRYVVADTFNHRISWYDNKLEHLQSIGRKGNKAGEFDRPRSLAITSEGNIVVADTGNQRVQVFTGDGEYLFAFGDLGKGPGQFKGPHGLAVDHKNNIYVADLYNHRIQVFDESGKFVRSFGKEGRLEGELSEPRAIAFTPSTSPGEAGNLLVAEMENQRVTMFSDDGQYLCIYGDSCEENSSFGCPSGVAVDSEGRIFISDSKLNVIHIL
ncbi:E3 ubiquitin-protein ligase TRIM71-like isoform X2 [Bolinopsis microptera]|uniref:E3 ubiquitin-protein ligase TRIM71-like isoform X2 n=1 Tax=Bolinopsis microptera TaxID=2820187 RepID=UPI003078DCC0